MEDFIIYIYKRKYQTDVFNTELIFAVKKKTH